MKARDVAIGDWIKYRAQNGAMQIAEVRAVYPFSHEPAFDTTHGIIEISAVIEVRKAAKPV